MKASITQAAFARQVGVSRQHIGRLVRAGVLVLRAGRLDPNEAAAAWALHQQGAQKRIRAGPKPTRHLGRRRPAPSKPTDAAPRLERTQTDPPPPSIERHAAALEDDLDQFTGEGLYDQARAERERWAARQAKLKYLKEAEVLVEKDEAERAFRSAAKKARDKLLSIPSRLRDALAAEDDPAKVYHLIESEILLALEELSMGGRRA